MWNCPDSYLAKDLEMYFYMHESGEIVSWKDAFSLFVIEEIRSVSICIWSDKVHYIL